jgi:hypothetical protein
MKRPSHLIWLVLLFIVLAACTPSGGGEPTAVPLPETFTSALNDFLSAGSKLNAATGQGVSYLDYRDYYAEAGGAYELALATWPDDFAAEAKDEFTKAMWGWDLTGVIWSAKIDDRLTLWDDPRKDEFTQYAGDALTEVNFGKGAGVQVSDKNISILLSMASEQFETGRDIILPLIP